MVSVVLPVRNERDNLAPVLAEIADALRSVPHEILAVDDGSTDGSLEILRSLQPAHARLRVIALREHAGQSAAIAAGWDRATGDVVVTMDADGQNDPGDIPALLNALATDPELAAAVGFRRVRSDSAWKRIQSRIANTVRNWITDDGIRDTGCSLKAIRRLDGMRLPRFDGMHRFLPALIMAHGGRVLEMPVNHRPRLSGASKYGMWDRAWRGLRDAFGVRWIGRRVLTFDVREDRGFHGPT